MNTLKLRFTGATIIMALALVAHPHAVAAESGTWSSLQLAGREIAPGTRGQVVAAGETLGKVVDPFTDQEFPVISPIAGEIIGMAVSQPVLSGYGLFHVAGEDKQ
jgi:hypothetical protein